MFVKLYLYFIVACQIFVPGFGIAKVINQEAHQKNCEIVAIVIEKALNKIDEKERCETSATLLSRQLNGLSKQFIAGGFDSSAYSYQTNRQDELCFTSDVLWEGGSYPLGEVPFTLLVYCWPPEHVAVERDRGRGLYASNIHGHAISCAFTVLQGNITQETYYLVSDDSRRVVRLEGEEIFGKGQGAFDDQHAPFIHRVVCRHQYDFPAVTFHAYGAPTQAMVRKIFTETADEYTFKYVLEPNGEIAKRDW